MGLPQVNIKFKSKALNIILRSARGIIGVVLYDTKATETKLNIITKYTDIDTLNFNEKNTKYINLLKKANPFKMLVVTVQEENLKDALKILTRHKYNWLTIPNISTEDTTKVVDYVDMLREKGTQVKAVLPHTKSNKKHIINFTGKNVVSDGEKYNTNEYCTRICGVLASLPFTRSSTYYVLDDIEDIDEVENPNEAIDNGELIIIHDGEKFKIGRGVTSLTTIEDKEMPTGFKKIRIVEARDMIHSDIKQTFDNEYVGHCNNGYDNKTLYLQGVNLYLRELQKEGVLNPNEEARAEINIDAQIKYLIDNGVDVETLQEQQIKEADTGSKVFIKANGKILDSMEDLDFEFNM